MTGVTEWSHHDHITMKSQSQDVTKGSPDGHKDCGRQGAWLVIVYIV